MRKDPTEFRKRFAAWKNGKLPYEAGLPNYEDGYESFLATLPDNQRKPGAYNTRRYWELNGKPKNFAEAIGKGMYNIQEDGGVLGWHANSVSYNENNDTYEFMKPNYHPTRWMELVEGYDKNSEFLKDWKVLYNGPMFSDRYVRREKLGLKVKGGQLPRFAMGAEGDTLYVEKDAHKGWKGVKNFLKSALNHTLYNLSSGSGGSTNPIHVLAGGANYTGSYIYPSSNYIHNLRTLSDDNGVGLAGSTKYGGKNAVEDRNIVAKQFGRRSNLKKLRDDTYRIGNISFTGPVYEGKIYPMNQDSVYYLPNSVKAEIDSLINVDRSYSVNMNNIRELNRRFPRQILDNVRNARLKPLKSNNKYSLKATKLWDFSSPNIQFGNLYDKLINLSGGNKFVLEQNIPIKFVNKDRTDDWDLIKSTLTQ